MKISFDGVGQWGATFECADVTEGHVVQVSAAGTVAKCQDGGAFAGVVEDKDCTPEQKAITELNSGVYVFDAPSLAAVLGSLRRANAQGEYYLTDAPLLLQKTGKQVDACRRDLGLEILGVNTPEQLAEVEALLP